MSKAESRLPHHFGDGAIVIWYPGGEEQMNAPPTPLFFWSEISFLAFLFYLSMENTCLNLHEAPVGVPTLSAFEIPQSTEQCPGDGEGIGLVSL